MEAQSTRAGVLDMAKRGDRAMLRQSIRRGWGTPETLKAEAVAALGVVLERAGAGGDGAEEADALRTLEALGVTVGA